MSEFLDREGVAYLWRRIKELVAENNLEGAVTGIDVHGNEVTVHYYNEDDQVETVSFPVATQEMSGLMSAADKQKLDGYPQEFLLGNELYVSEATGQIRVREMEGATYRYDGGSGLVPAPTSEDRDRVLSGSGDWIEIGDAYVLPTASANQVGGIKTGGIFGVDVNGVPRISEFGATDGRSAGSAGIVPAPTASDAGKFLSSDNGWVKMPIATEALDGLMSSQDKEKLDNLADPVTYEFSGAFDVDGNRIDVFPFTGTDGEMDGASGLVPAPTASDTNKFLASDGTWQAASAEAYELPKASTSVLGGVKVAEPFHADANGVLSADAFTGTDGSVNGKTGMVPAPYTTDANKFLASDGTWRTVDMEIPNATESASGLMSATDKAKLNGLEMPVFGDAFTVSENNVDIVTFTGTNGTANGTKGLVPAPGPGDADKYLASDGTWKAVESGIAEIPVASSSTVGGVKIAEPFRMDDGVLHLDVFTGTSGSASGASGIVPAPTASDANKFLSSDGTWQTVEMGTIADATTTSSGLMSASDKSKLDSLSNNGVTYTFTEIFDIDSNNVVDIDTFGGASSTSAGKRGAVPAPARGATNMYLSSSGRWVSLPVASDSADGLMSLDDKVKLDSIPIFEEENAFEVDEGILSLKDFIGTNGRIAGTHGAVPAPTANDLGKFLAADGTWQEITVATSESDGLMSAEDKAKIDALPNFSEENDLFTVNEGVLSFKNFTGATASVDGTNGAVPAPRTTDVGKFLASDGTWKAVEIAAVDFDVFSGATASEAGTDGLVPAPAVADKDSFLCGNGTWVAIDTISDNAIDAILV